VADSALCSAVDRSEDRCFDEPSETVCELIHFGLPRDSLWQWVAGKGCA
jgi:hypothetical protein